ncbi:porin [Halotalea alkalilenta]|uniref:Porin domain-containing protein n=1 Tax=Halotalea alkalilenta TaxID=376489 RepID=A0A172YJ79_9GAMM|nr:porin [Halotalea alkalilenta]ANF59259.1 hypothetical protein A5892_18845 [Halotalea alkalilenta]
MQRSAHRQIFKHSAIAVAVGLASMATVERAAAFTAFETPNNRFVINGRIAGSYDWNDGGSDEDNFNNAGSRINLVYEHYFADDWTALARTEWGFDPFFQHGDDNHTKRHLYVGLSNPTYGTVTVGKQYSVMYDLVDVYTDQPWLYTDYTSQTWMGYAGDWLGMQRPDRSIKYVVDVGDWTLGAMYGTSRGDIDSDLVGVNGSELVYADRGAEREYFAQLAFNYRLGYDVTLFAGYNYARISESGYTASEGVVNDTYEDDPNVNNWEVGFNWAPGNWYISALGGESRNLIATDRQGGVMQSARNYDTFAGYTFPGALGEIGDLQLYGQYSYAKDNDGDARMDRKIFGVAAITFNEQLIIALEHMIMDDKSDTGADAYDNDVTGILVRYNY